MRLQRYACAGLVAIVFVAAGCSRDTSPSGTPSSSSTQPNSPTTSLQSTPSPTAPGGRPDESTCLDIGLAKDNLMVAMKPENARAAADTLEKYGPPDPVKAAIEHFVTTVGAQPGDPGLDANSDTITGWVKQICPNVKP